MSRFVVEPDQGPFDSLALCDRETGSRAEVAPGRGGMLTRLRVHGQDVLYLDEDSFLDATRNVRGGNPVLFPTPGKLTNDRWGRAGEAGKLKQHGFARVLPWSVVSTGTDHGAWVRLRLSSSDDTRDDWPWEFQTDFTYRLLGDTVRIEIDVHNPGTRPMPYGVGFHPYFEVPQARKDATQIGTAATRGLDNRTGERVAFRGFTLGADEVDMHLEDHGTTWSPLRRPDRQHAVIVRGSEAFTHWVVWTLAGRDFVCLEPWTCPGDAMNTGDRLEVVHPGDTAHHWLSITYR